MTEPKILLTNDDGIRAPGIRALHDVLLGAPGSGFDGPLHVGGNPAGVVVVAPLTVQSATSHGVTFHEPLMIREEVLAGSLRGIAVDGRPADCVKLAISSLWPERFGPGARPALVLSGMNSGANCGVNVIYSGTVAAAIEAAFLGIPAVAVSLHLGRGQARYDVAARHARGILEDVLSRGLSPHECLNVNLPVTEKEAPAPPVRVARMNAHGHVDRYERRVSPSGDVYYWAAGNGLDFHSLDPGSDVDELFRSHATVTPLRYDLTADDRFSHWLRHFEQGLP